MVRQLIPHNAYCKNSFCYKILCTALILFFKHYYGDFFTHKIKSALVHILKPSFNK